MKGKYRSKVNGIPQATNGRRKNRPTLTYTAEQSSFIHTRVVTRTRWENYPHRGRERGKLFPLRHLKSFCFAVPCKYFISLIWKTKNTRLSIIPITYHSPNLSSQPLNLQNPAIYVLCFLYWLDCKNYWLIVYHVCPELFVCCRLSLSPFSYLCCNKRTPKYEEPLCPLTPNRCEFVMDLEPFFRPMFHSPSFVM